MTQLDPSLWGVAVRIQINGLNQLYTVNSVKGIKRMGENAGLIYTEPLYVYAIPIVSVTIKPTSWQDWTDYS